MTKTIEMENKFTNIKERILYISDYYNISREKFFENLGISYGNFKGKAKKTPINSMFLENILTNFGEISPEWLITGKGDMLRNSENGNIIASNKLIPTTSQCGVPLIPIEAIAGLPANDNYGVRFIDCAHYIVPDFIDKGVEYLIRVSGSSMYPKYSSGDILACKRVTDILFFQWGKIYVIDSSQGALVKRIFEDTENTANIILVSDNKEKYPPFSFPKSDIRSLSIVIGVIRLE